MNDPAAPGTMLVCFAVPDESRLFTKGLENRRVVYGDSRHRLPTVFGEVGNRPVVVAHTGVGDSASARESLSRLLAGTPPCAVISAGYAGALQPGFAVGHLVLGENCTSHALLTAAHACLQDQPVHAGMLFTSDKAVETAEAKHALGLSTGALAVDMETAWIADLSARAGVPMLSLRVISDAADQDFPVPGWVLYDVRRQRPRYLALPAWLAMHPGRIAPFARFVRGLGPARDRLTHALRTVLASL